jgi:hypothetical protein
MAESFMDATLLSPLSAIINFGMVVLIWLVQLIIYPGMHGWQQARFAELHQTYTRQISAIVGPLILIQLLLSLLLLFQQRGVVELLQLILLGVMLGVTFLVSVPLHRLLSRGYDDKLVDRLVRTNWLRTFGWSLVSLLDVFGRSG